MTYRRHKFIFLTTIVFLLSALLSSATIFAQTQPATPIPPTPTVFPTSTPTPPPTQIPTPTLSMNERVTILELELEKVQSSPKDFWDKFSIWSSLLASIISGGVIAGVGLWATNVYRQKQLEVDNQRLTSESDQRKHENNLARIQTIHTFLPQLQSSDPKVAKAAIFAISALGEGDLIANVINLFDPQPAIEALVQLTETEDNKTASQARQSLARLGYLAEQRIFEIVQNFNGQQVPGSLFGSNSPQIKLPKIGSIKGLDSFSGPDTGVDIILENDTHIWLIQVKAGLPNRQSVKRIISRMQEYPVDLSKERIIWLAILEEIPQLIREELSIQGIFTSSAKEIEQIEIRVNSSELELSVQRLNEVLESQSLKDKSQLSEKRKKLSEELLAELSTFAENNELTVGIGYISNIRNNEIGFRSTFSPKKFQDIRVSLVHKTIVENDKIIAVYFLDPPKESAPYFEATLNNFDDLTSVAFQHLPHMFKTIVDQITLEAAKAQ